MCVSGVELCAVLVSCTQNMVAPGDVDEDLKGETQEECSKFGEVKQVLVHEVRHAPSCLYLALRMCVSVSLLFSRYSASCPVPPFSISLSLCLPSGRLLCPLLCTSINFCAYCSLPPTTSVPAALYLSTSMPIALHLSTSVPAVPYHLWSPCTLQCLPSFVRLIRHPAAGCCR